MWYVTYAITAGSSLGRGRETGLLIDCAGDGDDVEASEHQSMEHSDLTTGKFKLEGRA
jgi:hypothetical protein